MRIRVRVHSRWGIAAGFIAAIAALILGSITYGPITQTTASVNTVTQDGPPQSAVATTARNVSGDAVVLASPGRIEGKTDTVEVGAATDGVIQSLYVKEGDPVRKGQLLADLDCRDLRSTLPVSKSEAESLRQVRARLLLGSRTEEREAAAQRTAGAKAVLAHAVAQLERQRQLAEAQAVSRSAFDDAKRDAGVAESEYQLAVRNEALVNAGPLAEEIGKASADVESAEKRVALAEEKLAKCSIRAPMDGAVLQIMLHPSESFALVSPRPILKMADVSGRRVRAEVDEHDVGKIHLGQVVEVSSDAYSGRRFNGTVTRIASMMGRKSVMTGAPSEKTDRDILEVMAELEPAAIALPLGLRATVHFHH